VTVGPVTLITGSSTGIGRATALELARRGHHVYATMRNLDGSDDLRATADKESLRLHFLQLDVTDSASVTSALATVLRSAGRIDNLVSNAGYHAGNALEETELATFRGLMETNFFGGIRCIQAVLPHFRENRAGCILSVTSQSGRITQPTCSAYCASKFAMEAALETLAIEVAQFGVRVAIIEPGLTFTAAQRKSQPWPSNTAYEETYRRTGAVFAAGAAEGSSAELVAHAVAAAIADPQPRLRYLVGADAERNLAGRAKISDEQWVALHGATRTTDFFARWAQIFGIDPTPHGEPRSVEPD
jgi:NAD(P)-dependent dehydrogenase (short-subunit alcohol dehydrogenase family)